jgi:hypothetical protein
VGWVAGSIGTADAGSKLKINYRGSQAGIEMKLLREGLRFAFRTEEAGRWVVQTAGKRVCGGIYSYECVE